MEAPTFPFSSCQISFAKCSLVIDFSFCCFHYICWQLRKNGDCLFSLTEIPVQTSINRVCFQKCHISKIAFPDEKIFKFFVLWLDPFSLWKMPSLLPSLLSSGWMRKVPIILMFTWAFGAKEKPAISSVHMKDVQLHFADDWGSWSFLCVFYLSFGELNWGKVLEIIPNPNDLSWLHFQSHHQFMIPCCWRDFSSIELSANVSENVYKLT